MDMSSFYYLQMSIFILFVSASLIWGCFFPVIILKIQQNFLWDIFAIPFLTKLQAYSVGCNFNESDVLTKMYSNKFWL